MSTIIFIFKIVYIHIPLKILSETNSDVVSLSIPMVLEITAKGGRKRSDS